MPRVHCRNGFTFIELLVVIILVGVVAALILPQMSAARDGTETATNTHIAQQEGGVAPNPFDGSAYDSPVSSTTWLVAIVSAAIGFFGTNRLLDARQARRRARAGVDDAGERHVFR